MPVCQYFLEGRCMFGDRCRNDHFLFENVNQRDIWNKISQIAVDICLAEKGGQWPLSCYGPYFENRTYPGLEDMSPDEIRWLHYQALASGRIDQFVAFYKGLLQKAAQEKHTLKEPSLKSVAQIGNLLLSNTNKNSGAFQKSTGNSNFFNPQANSSQTSVFGGQSQKPTSSIFSQQSQSLFNNTGTDSIFGSSQAQSFSKNPSSFGNQSIFGDHANANQNIFAGEKTNQNIFSGTSSDSKSAFAGNNTDGNSIFGLNSKSNQNIFTASGTNNQNVFAPSGTSNQNVFAPSSSNNQNIFAANSTGSQNIFAGSSRGNHNIFASNASSQSIFGNNKNTSNENGTFGQLTNSAVTQQISRTSKITTPAAGTVNIFTEIDSLTKVDKEAFEADKFTFGKIPISPPPKTLC